LQKRPIILRSLLNVATPYEFVTRILKLKKISCLVGKFANFFQNPEIHGRNETAAVTTEMKSLKLKLLCCCVKRGCHAGGVPVLFCEIEDPNLSTSRKNAQGLFVINKHRYHRLCRETFAKETYNFIDPTNRRLFVLDDDECLCRVTVLTFESPRPPYFNVQIHFEMGWLRSVRSLKL